MNESGQGTPLLRRQALGRRFGLWFGLTILTIVLLGGFFLPLPYPPTKPDPTSILLPPSAGHWFGTDTSGFDVFSRTVASARHDLPLAVLGALFSGLLGVPLGLAVSIKGASGERGMRALDAFQAFPLLILAVTIVTLAGNRLNAVVLAIVVINVPLFMRLVRSEALALREARFVEAAEAIGASRSRILGLHILPNLSGVILVQSSITAAHALIVIAALSFLGIGVSPPEPSWGIMIQSGAKQISSGQWWVSVFPGLAIFAVVMSFNLVGDALEIIFERTD